MKTSIIPLSQIVPDTDQPRQYFSAEKMKTLSDSIKSVGIKSPLIVQEIGKGKFLIIDGERRFRAATQLKLKEVPVVVEPTQNAVDRLVSQFNIQEQHQSWTPLEKAVALTKLSKELGLSLPKTCRLLNVTDNESSRYAAFAALADMKTWVRNEIPLDYATGMKGLNSFVKRIKQETLEEDWNLSDAKKLEHRVIANIKNGDIKGRNNLSKLKDAFHKNPKLIDKFLEDEKTTPSSMFSEAKARGAYHFRNLMNNAMWVVSHGGAFLESKDVKVSSENAEVLKRAISVAKQIIDLAE